MKPAKALIEATANAIKDHFIPKDAAVQSFSFCFTIPPASNYKVTYAKNQKGNWVLLAYEEDRVIS